MSKIDIEVTLKLSHAEAKALWRLLGGLSRNNVTKDAGLTDNEANLVLGLYSPLDDALRADFNAHE